MEISTTITSALVVVLPLCLLILTGVLGYELMRLMGLMRHPQKKELVIVLPLLSVFFGATIVGILMYLASLVGALSRPAIWTLVLMQLGIAVVRRDFISVVKEALQGLGNTLAVKSRWTQIISFLALLVFVAFVISGLLCAILPTLEADSATAYLNAANLFLNYQKLIDVGHFVGNMGKTGFLQLTYGMGIFSSQLGHAWLFILSASGILLLFLIVGQLAGYSIASVILVVLTTSNYAIDSIIMPAKFDGLSFALSAAALTLLVLIAKGERQWWVFVAVGTITGFLAGVSYNNIAVAGIIMLALLGLVSMGKEAHRVRYTAIAFVAAVIASAPTYIQNIALFGNPIYPFAGNLFGSGLGPTIPQDGFAYGYISEISKDHAASSLVDVFRLPLFLFGQYSDEIQASHDPWLGALLFMALGGGAWLGLRLVVSSRARKDLAVPIRLFILGVGGVWLIYVFWAVTQHMLRYFSAGLPFAVISCGMVAIVAWHSIRQSGCSWFRHVCAVAALVVIGLMTKYWSPQILSKVRPVKEWVINGQTESDYVAANFVYGGVFPFGRAIAELKPRLQDGDKVLSFITGNYYFGNNVRTFSGNGSNTLPSPDGMAKPLSRFSDWSEWETHLRSQQFSYLVINPNYLYLSAREKPIVLGYLSHRQPDLTIGDTLVFRIQ